MTSFQKLPDETLYLVFQNLDGKDLQQCQKVCRSFYFTAHILVLHNIDLKKTCGIKQFINSIDHNPDPSYLKAVKKIKLGGANEEKYVLCKGDIKKLFFRFPNLQEVQFRRASLTLFEGFNDELCKEILDFCPELEVFHEVESQYEYYYRPSNFNLLKKLRLLVTTIDLRNTNSTTTAPFGGDAQLLLDFPRLKNVLGVSNELDTIEKWLPILRNSPNLKSLKIRGSGGDQHKFAEKYLSTLSQNEQDGLVETLSEIEMLDLTYRSGFTSNATEFVNEYLTSLEEIHLNVSFENHWHASQQLSFCTSSLDLIDSTEIYSHLNFTNMTADIMRICFPVVINRVFQQPNDESRTLCIELAGPMLTEALMEMDMTVAHVRELTVYSNESNGFSVLDIAKCLFGSVDHPSKIIPRQDVDEFILCIPYRNRYNVEIDFNMYTTILQAVPSAKKVILDIPTNLKEQVVADDVVFSNVEDLTIRATKNGQIQTLLNTLADTFPNLSSFNLLYNCGILDQAKGVFQVLLSNYSIKALTFDITPLKLEMFAKSIKVDWFVVDVESVQDHKRRLFKVSVDFSSVTSIHTSDLEGSEDYLSVYVLANNVERLKLCVVDVDAEELSYRLPGMEDEDDIYFHDPTEEEQVIYTTLFDHCLK